VLLCRKAVNQSMMSKVIGRVSLMRTGSNEATVINKIGRLWTTMSCGMFWIFLKFVTEVNNSLLLPIWWLYHRVLASNSVSMECSVYHKHLNHLDTVLLKRQRCFVLDKEDRSSKLLIVVELFSSHCVIVCVNNNSTLIISLIYVLYLWGVSTACYKP